MKTKIVLLILIFLCSFTSFGQLITSEKNTIAEIFNSSFKKVKLSGGETSVEFSFWALKSRYIDSTERYKSLKEMPDRNKLTAVKHGFLTAKVGTTGTTKFMDLDEFNYKDKLGLVLGLSYRGSFDSIIYRDGKSANLYSYKISFEYRYDKVSIYNSDTNLITTESPDNYKIEYGGNLYFFNLSKKFLIISSLNAKWNIKTSNKDDLVSYKKIDSEEIINDEIITGNSFDGKYGILDESVRTGNLSYSLSFVPLYEKKSIPLFFVTPYLSYEFFNFKKPVTTTGFCLNISDYFVKTDNSNKLKQKNNEDYVKTFSTPSILSIGIDWSKIEGRWTEPNWFLTGSFAF